MTANRPGKFANQYQVSKNDSSEFDSPTVRRRFRETYGVDVFKPDVHLVLGREWDFAQVHSIKKMKRDAEIRIETWIEVVERLKREFS